MCVFLWVSISLAAETAKTTASPCAKSWSTKLNGFDRPAGVLQTTSLDYPRRAEWDEVGGNVVVSLDISSEGKLSAVTILCTDAPGYFEAYVQKAVRDWAFVPGQKDGQDADFFGLVITFEFDPRRRSAALRSHPVVP
jgi:TonB family protein